jgi:ABC-type branched-subunit amino acid transport system substrate-binding protein
VRRSLIRAIVRAGADGRLVDSVRRKQGSISVIQLFGPRGRRIADSLHLKTIVPLMRDENLDIPTLTIQGIFIPITDADEIGIVASQIKYFNIQTQILGSSEWYDIGQLDAHRRDAAGAVFISDFYVNRNDSLYKRFVQQYAALTHRQPTKFSLIGFDAMSLLLDVIGGKAVTRETIAAALEQKQSYRGIHSFVDLTHGRVNSFLHVLRYQKGDVDKIGEIVVH